MLSYKPPFLECGNLTIFHDDSNADVFYYVCQRPSIVLNDNLEPNVEAYAILPQSGETLNPDGIEEASLMLDVCLKATDEELELAKKAIGKMLGQTARTLVPAPIKDGKVYFMVAAAGKEADPETWFISGEVKPSLIGDNIASLMVRAKGKDAKLIIAALNEDVIAASVHYDLQFVGIAPVFKASMKVDWKKVYHHFEEFDKSNFIFSTDEVSATVDKMSETHGIEIQIDELDPDIKSEALKSLMNELKTEVFKKIFQPAASPLGASQKWEERIANGASRVLAAIAPGVHHIRRNIDEAQLFSTSVSLSQRNAKAYPFYPQALVSSLLRDAGGIKDKIKWIKLDEIPFITQSVNVEIAKDTFANSNITSAHVECEVLNRNTNEKVYLQSFVFSGEDAGKKVFTYTRTKDEDYVYKYKATLFLKSSNALLPDRLEIGPIEDENPFIYINAEGFFDTNELTINLDDTAIFENAHLIECKALLSDNSSGKEIQRETFLFKADDAAQKTISVIAPKAMDLVFNIDVTYFIKDAPEHKAAFPNINKGFFFIPNPFENKWSVDIICHADWEKTRKLMVETRLEDAEREDPLLKDFEFTKELTEQKLSARVSNSTAKNSFEYRVTTISLEGVVGQSAWKMHEGPFLVVKDEIVSERTILATLTSAPDKEAMEIKQMGIEFIYSDPANNLEITSDRIPLTTVGETVSFTHPMPDFSKKEYSYRLYVRGRSGNNFKTEYVKSTSEKINVIIPDKIW